MNHIMKIDLSAVSVREGKKDVPPLLEDMKELFESHGYEIENLFVTIQKTK